jgi:hypothetical protein
MKEKKGTPWSAEAKAKAAATRALKAGKYSNEALTNRVRDALHSLHQCYATFPKEKEHNGMPGDAKTLLMIAIKRLEGRM